MCMRVAEYTDKNNSYFIELSGSQRGEYDDDMSYEMMRHLTWQKFIDDSEVLAASIIRAITRHNIPEDSYLQ